MKLQFWTIGKDHDPTVRPGVEDFTKRISHYFKGGWKIIPVPKNASLLNEAEMKKKEAGAILATLDDGDYLIALDQTGKQLSSEVLAEFIQARANESHNKLVFLIGGAYGLDEAVLKRAQFRWSLSKLTFPHQLVRLILAEQVYRACTIMRHERYHHGNEK